MQSNNVFSIWLAECIGHNSPAVSSVIASGLTPYDLYEMGEEDIDLLPWASEKLKEKLLDKNLSASAEILDRCESQDIHFTTPFGTDTDYPPLLSSIQNPPAILYYKGSLDCLKTGISLAMVGTRNMSQNGMQSAYEIAYELASLGVTVVSGMAAGIDGVSAGGALAAKGKTIAVLGCGVDIAYPSYHKTLSEKIAEFGAIVSEYAPGTLPRNYFFPARNRIISGMCLGTLVIEAGEGSGSLITAKDAILQGRDVFAMPANVHSKRTQGTNGLLRDGARILLSTDDIFDVYGSQAKSIFVPEHLNESRKHSQINMGFLASLGVLEQLEDGTFAIPGTVKHGHKKTDAPAQAPEVKSEKPKQQKPLSEEKSEIKTENKPTRDWSACTDKQRLLLENTPDDRAFSEEELSGIGLDQQELAEVLLDLELDGILQSLPGGLYIKS